MPCLRIVVPLLAAIIIFGIVPARAEDPPPPVDAARQSERYAIQPGSEALFGDMLGKGETLPGGCTLTDGKIERTSVLATYTCGDKQVALLLLHPSSAASAKISTERFAVEVQSGTPPAGLVEAVADRIRTREAGFAWNEVGGDAGTLGEIGGTSTRWLALAGGVVLVLFALRRRARRAGND